MFYTYIIANAKHGAIFTGHCDDLSARMREHKMARFGRSASAMIYSIDRLMWFEAHESRDAAIKRERDIKTWSRERRLELFEESNPDWADLSMGLTDTALTVPSCVPANGFHSAVYPELALAS
jgi:predicted GIY-YIG superfamily endonuclease